MARALAQFDEYQLMKYAAQKEDVRLCDVIAMVRGELEELGDEARLALDVGAYLHASSRRRRDLVSALPMTSARRALFSNGKSWASDPRFGSAVAEARVTWEQVLGHFGISDPEKTGAHKEHNHAIWDAMLNVDGLLPDMAFLRNVRNMTEADVARERLVRGHEHQTEESLLGDLRRGRLRCRGRQGAQSPEPLTRLVAPEDLGRAEAVDGFVQRLDHCPAGDCEAICREGQKSACIVFDSRQFRTLRDAQSMIATRYRKPFLTGTKVMSAHQTWLGRSICIFLSKYG